MARPALSAVVELLKPITWFAPMWAFCCGVVSTGLPAHDRLPVIAAGVLLTGPLVCGTSQAVNDWFDRHVDAINEPNRPIPSGRIPGRWGLTIAIGWTVVSMIVATALGPWGFGAAALGMGLAWAYSAPPLRLKRNGWWGNTAVAACYEGLPWFTGAAVMAAARPDWRILVIAVLYSAGAHGIMTLNDFKSVDGDRATGIGSLPVRLGVESRGTAGVHRDGRAAGVGGGAAAVVGTAVACHRHRAAHCRPGGADAPPAGKPAGARTMVQRHRHDALCDRHAGQRFRAASGGVVVSAPVIGEPVIGAPVIGAPVIVRLGLVQAAIGAIVVLATSTMNRVMVVEEHFPAILPGALVALHYGVQMLRPHLGYGSDLGRRRTPWIVGGMAVLVSGGMAAAVATAWMAVNAPAGIALAVMAFAMIGLGVGACGTSLLVLLSERVAPARRSTAASVVWLMMIAGIAVTASVAGRMLEPFSATRLLMVTASAGGLAMVLTLVAVWHVEAGAPVAVAARPNEASFAQTLAQIWADAPARRFTIFVFVSMFAYSAQELILEPFVGAVFHLTPGESTALTGLQHGGVLLGMLLVAVATGALRIGSTRGWTVAGCLGSALAIVGLAAAAGMGSSSWLRPALFVLGATNGAFAVSAIGAMMGLAHAGQDARAGTRMGLWGAAQALAFGLGGLVGTGSSDLARRLLGAPDRAYAAVFMGEAVLFVFAALQAMRVFPSKPRQAARSPTAQPRPVASLSGGN